MAYTLCIDMYTKVCTYVYKCVQVYTGTLGSPVCVGLVTLTLYVTVLSVLPVLTSCRNQSTVLNLVEHLFIFDNVELVKHIDIFLNDTVDDANVEDEERQNNEKLV